MPTSPPPRRPDGVSGVGPDDVQPWKSLTNLIQNKDRAIAICKPAEWTITRSGSPSTSTRPCSLRPFYLLAGVITRGVLFAAARSAPFPPLSAIGCRGLQRSGWPRDRALRATPSKVPPKCAPMRLRAGTSGKCCRPSSGEERSRSGGVRANSCAVPAVLALAHE